MKFWQYESKLPPLVEVGVSLCENDKSHITTKEMIYGRILRIVTAYRSGSLLVILIKNSS